MVDFQQRDTTRGLGSDDEDEEEDDENEAEANPDPDTDPGPGDEHEADDGGNDGEGGHDSGSSGDDRDHGHDHGGGHDHSHDHGGDHDHGHDHSNDHGHDHDNDHGHDHSNDHDHDHHHAHDLSSVGAAVVTVSSTRTHEDDPAGDAIAAAFEDAGHEVAVREILRDDYDKIQSVVDVLVGRSDVDAVVTTGGTGVTPDDVTIEAIEPLFDKHLPGFGELFRRLSYDEIGTRVVGTRAAAGVVDGVPVFCLPGSENAARLGAGEVIVPEVGHLAGLARRNEDDGEE
ncbi:molybdenum cofactor biosynthesis protein B [Halobacteriales archaeon QS_1_68_17]|nr:MAG: molybdenum cofactor biosynthesis protein B [Halobacteriales archaeon QS_1_68_17]